MKKVGIVMGSDSDLPIVQKTIDVLKDFKVPYEVNVYSAHRTPDEAIAYAKKAKENDFAVIIAAAGMAAHLAGVIAANTTIPVIGIPCTSESLDGLDALMSTVQMPSGVPVATVAINGASNAAYLALEILAINNKKLEEKLINKRNEMKEKVLAKNTKIKELI